MPKMQHSKLHQNADLNKLYFPKKPMHTAPLAPGYSNPCEPLDLPLYPAARQTYNNRPKAPNTKQNQCKRMPNGRVCNLCLRYLLHTLIYKPALYGSTVRVCKKGILHTLRVLI